MKLIEPSLVISLNLIHFTLMLFSLPSMWNMVKYTSNHIPENVIGYDQTTREIHEDGISLYSRYF